MRVVDGKITEHWGVATLLDLMQQLGVVPAFRSAMTTPIAERVAGPPYTWAKPPSTQVPFP